MYYICAMVMNRPISVHLHMTMTLYSIVFRKKGGKGELILKLTSEMIISFILTLHGLHG